MRSGNVGDHQKRTVVLVHGFMGDPSDWDFVRQGLAGFNVITPLLRPATSWQAGVEQLAEEIPMGSVLVGYSMGARLSLGVALSDLDLVSGLFFCSGNPGIEDEEQRRTRYQHDLRIAERIETSERREFLEWWYTESTVFKSLTPQVREDEIRRKSVRVADDWSEILRRFSVAKQPDYWPQLGELTMPVMAVAGAQDRKYARFVARMGEASNVSARIIAACGHIVHREQPHIFVRLLKQFLFETAAD